MLLGRFSGFLTRGLKKSSNWSLTNSNRGSQKSGQIKYPVIQPRVLQGFFRNNWNRWFLGF
jgi:hypothetical protein